MAVDTHTKRRSALGATLAFLVIAPLADGTVANVDREHILGIYAGITLNLFPVNTSKIHIFSSVAVEPSHATDSADNVLIKGVIEAQAGAYVGGADNHLDISATGVVILAGTAKRDLTLRPDMDYTAITAQGKPTAIVYGAYSGYSLPLYAADEEMFFNINVPGRWDGASNIILDVLVCLSAGEDVNDDFNLQLSWANSELGEPILNTTTDVPVETNILAGRNAAYDTYMVSFVIDYDVDAGNHIVAHDDLAMRLRRIAVAGIEITGEVIVLDFHMHFTVDKMFKAPE